MPVLKNPRHELFAQNVAKGMTQDEAYELSWSKSNRSWASKTRRRPDISARIDEILQAGASRAEITIEMVLREFAKIGFANAADYFEWGPGGVTIKPSLELTPDQRAVVCEVQETKAKGHGKSTIKVKLADKQRALENIGRHLGMFKDNLQISGPSGGPIQIEGAGVSGLLAAVKGGDKT